MTVLSCQAAPLVLRDAHGQLAGALKLEQQVLSKSGLRLSGWVLGSSRLAVFRQQQQQVTELKLSTRNDVATAFAVAIDQVAGFEIHVPRPGKQALTLHWTLSIDGADTTFEYPLEPASDATAEETISAGAVDGMLDGVIHGWAWNSTQAGTRVTVEFLLGKKLLGQVLCDEARPDLAQAGFGDGQYGFHWPLPADVAVNDLGALQVRIAGSSTLLPGALKPCCSSLAATQSYDGELDLAWPDHLAGVLRARSRALPAMLEVMVNDEVVSQIAVQPGPDPAGSRGRVGRFHWQVPSLLREVPADAVALRLPTGQWLELPRLHQQSKKSAAKQASAPAKPIVGNVEQLTTTGVSGWAWDPANPDTPVELAIFVDGEVIGTTRANRFAARLRGEGRSGHQHFSFKFSTTLYNGQTRQVAVQALRAGFDLPCARSLLKFPLVSLQLFADPAAVAPAYAPAWDDAHGRRWWPLKARGKSPRISLVMLNWNGGAMLDDFFASLERHPPALKYELLVVDHGSTDHSLALLKLKAKKLPLRIIARGKNYSYADSNNHAARLARGDYLLFINNDIVLQHDCASVMAAVLDDARIGIVGARLLEPLRDADGKWCCVPHHEGIQFAPALLPDQAFAYYAPQELADVAAEHAGSVLRMPAVTAALMMCRKKEFLAAGGFNDRYFYGMEDVDFCLQFRQQIGKEIVCALAASAIHNRSATRELKRGDDMPALSYNPRTHIDNRQHYLRRHGRQLVQPILQSLLAGDGFYRAQPLRVTFAVTEAGLTTAAGDFYTAYELGHALQQQFGWEVCFSEQTNTAIPATDVLVAMRHDFDLRRITGANPGLVTIAWVRNRTEEWLARADFADYQLVFASSQKIVAAIHQATGRRPVWLPIATNPQRFSPERADVAHGSDVVFTGNNHGAARTAAEMAHAGAGNFTFAIYGHRWNDHKKLKRYSRGALPYGDIATAYASAKIVIDDSHPVTRDWNSLNSRVFDALACGKVVLTNCSGGAHELFGRLLPTFTTAEELQKKLNDLLTHDRRREKLAQQLRKIVLTKHTYTHRAVEFKQALTALLKSGVMRFSIKVPVPSEAEKQQWGDYHFALGIKRALERQGHLVRIDLLPEWYAGTGAADQVVIVLRGLSRYKPSTAHVNLMWLISHPHEVDVDEMQQYDHVFVASAPYTATLAKTLGDRVSTLLQCTDAKLFYPAVNRQLVLPPVLFIGNSRGQQRAVIEHALAAEAELGVYGGNWQGLLPAQHLLGDFIPNDKLREYYSSASVLLNDHWSDMRQLGFLSNRLFDAGACGAVLLSDKVAGLQEVFGDGIATYTDAKSFRVALQQLQQEPKARRKRAAALSKQVLAQHTFDHRIATILATLAKHHKFA